MPKLPVVTNRELANYLQKKGFQLLRHGSRHDVFSCPILKIYCIYFKCRKYSKMSK